MAKKLQIQLDLLAPWFDDWKFFLNASKIVVMLFGNKLKRLDPIQIKGELSIVAQTLNTYIQAYIQAAI